MDYDNDGIQDIISGSYDPGDIYLLRGLGDGEYAAVESITDQDGTPLVHHPTEFKRHLERVAASENPEQAKYAEEGIQDLVASFGSWPTLMDWDDDGDLDVLIGTFAGEIYLRKNIGTREQPEYDGASEKVLVDGKPLKEQAHANPVAVDWDADGLIDLVVGSGNGGVGWYKNLGSGRFGPKQVLVGAPSEAKFLIQYLRPDEASVPGTRAQICVVDFNHDGRLDLLVGDHSNKVALDSSWSPQKTAELNEAFHQTEAAGKCMSAVQKRMQEKYAKAIEDQTVDMEAFQIEMKAEMEKAQKEVATEGKPLSKEIGELAAELVSEGQTISHVWLYLRKPDADSTDQTSHDPTDVPTATGLSYDPKDISTTEIETLELTIKDTERDRTFGALVYLPESTDPAPVIIHSHGLGGKKETSSFLGKHWAARGYVAVFLQHPGSDDSIWKDVPRLRIMRELKNAANAENLLLRTGDVSSAIDKIEQWNADSDHALAGRMDLKHIGMSGHSYGAVTTQYVSGQKPFGEIQTDSRISAAIPMSPSQPRFGSTTRAFQDVKIPWLCMTGTKDKGVIGGSTPASRLGVFAALPAGDKFQLVLHDAEHLAFTESSITRGWLKSKKRNPKHHPAIKALTTAFWDTYLKRDPSAKAWINNKHSVRSVLEPNDVWQSK